MIETFVLIVGLSVVCNGWFFGYLLRRPDRASDVPIVAPFTVAPAPDFTLDWEGLV